MKGIYRFLVGMIIGCLLVGCRPRDPILIGISVELSGNAGKIGVAVRNGAQLAVEQINAGGGINGREIQVVVRDDQGDPEIARKNDQELIDMGVVAIIGHVTSQQTVSVYDLVNGSGVILFSPTSASPELTGIKDNFFRPMQDNRSFGGALGWVIGSDYGIRELVGVFDLANEAFSMTLWENARITFEAMGGKVIGLYTFQSGVDDLSEVMEEISEIDPEALLFVASDADTALMAQYGRLNGMKARYFSSSWAQTDELIRKGGSAVEGMVLTSLFNPNSQEERFLEFLEAYQQKFKVDPILGSSHAYESVMILAAGLRQTGGELEGLAEALSSIREFPGVQGSITMDEFGDVSRQSYFVVIEDREFQTVDFKGSEEDELP
jgi:branched-chain amino acid transport system substrate-binding protein